MSLDDNTVPQVLYNTPDPLAQPSELYVVHGTILPSAIDPVKQWVVKEEHGYWDQQEKKFKIRVTTFLPNEPQYAVSLNDIHDEVQKQVIVRVKQGFKYQMEWYPYEPPFYRKFEIQPNGTRKQY